MTDASTENTVVSNGSVTVNLKGEELDSFTFRFDMETEIAGVKTTYHTTYTARFSTPDESISVTLPQGYESF